MKVHRKIRVSGRVQGVYFRATTVDVARSLGLSGFVRNEKDGSVYIEAEGEEADLKKLEDWCRQGPPRAAVTHVGVTAGEVTGFNGFTIAR
jgi:acylphosphatase